MIVRLMRLGDVDAVAQIERASFSNTWSGNAFLYELQNPHALNYVAVMQDRRSAAATSGGIDGYACLHSVADELHLLKIAVDPSLRRRGIATHLLQYCIKEGNGMGKSAIILEVRPSNRPAIVLYEKFGFEVIAIRPDYYVSETGLKEDAMIMRKNLTGGN